MGSKFYVYTLCDPRKPGKYRYEGCRFDYEPFYVGKGTGGRANAHTKGVLIGQTDSNVYKNRKIKNILLSGSEPIVLTADRRNEDHAFKTEKNLIAAIGRRDAGGPLTNLTDGGEGVVGAVWTEERRKQKAKEVKRFWNSLSETEKKRRREDLVRRVEPKRAQIGQSVSEAFAKQTPEMKRHLSRLHSRSAKRFWSSEKGQKQKRAQGRRLRIASRTWRENASEAEIRASIEKANAKRAEKRASRTPKQEAEHRRKLSEGVKAAYAQGVKKPRTGPMSKETRARMAEAQRKRWKSVEARDNMSKTIKKSWKERSA